MFLTAICLRNVVFFPFQSTPHTHYLSARELMGCCWYRSTDLISPTLTAGCCVGCCCCCWLFCILNSKLPLSLGANFRPPRTPPSSGSNTVGWWQAREEVIMYWLARGGIQIFLSSVVVSNRSVFIHTFIHRFTAINGYAACWTVVVNEVCSIFQWSFSKFYLTFILNRIVPLRCSLFA